MSSRPQPADIRSIAELAGVSIDSATAARIVRSIGPALENFAPIAGTLPIDLEPASFVVAQLRALER